MDGEGQANGQQRLTFLRVAAYTRQSLRYPKIMLFLASWRLYSARGSSSYSTCLPADRRLGFSCPIERGRITFGGLALPEG